MAKYQFIEIDPHITFGTTYISEPANSEHKAVQRTMEAMEDTEYAGFTMEDDGIEFYICEVPKEG